MKSKTLFIVSILVVMFGLVGVYAKSYSTLQEYEDSINYSCQADSDCVVKDVHHCCGYYPMCTNKNALVNATFVIDACKKEGFVGVCGYPAIDYCKCENKKCVWKQGESNLSCKNLYWFDNENKECEQKEFCGVYLYQGLQTFESKTQCEKALNETCIEKEGECCLGGVCNQAYVTCLEGTEQTFNGCDNNCMAKSECKKVCQKSTFKENNKCYKNLSNGRNAEIKIMPETASARAIERLGELNFTIELKEVGKDDDAKVVYELTGNKEGKFLGIFKIMAKVKAQVDAENGDVKIIKPWWSFLASGI